jgi:putative ribosome biogenesis GTPase RsgA
MGNSISTNEFIDLKREYCIYTQFTNMNPLIVLKKTDLLLTASQEDNNLQMEEAIRILNIHMENQELLY